MKKAIGSFQGLPKLRLGSKQDSKLQDGFKYLQGFSANTEVDRKLLAGIFDKAELENRSKN